MGLLSREDMQERLNELSNPETGETRRVELITELGQQHVSGLEEFEALQADHETTRTSLGESRDAMAKMYNQLNAQTFGGAEGKTQDPSLQETVTLEDLLNR